MKDKAGKSNTFFDKLSRESKFVKPVSPEQVVTRKPGGASPLRATRPWTEIEKAIEHARELRPYEAYQWTLSGVSNKQPALALRRAVIDTAVRHGLAMKVGKAWVYDFEWRVDVREGLTTFSIAGKSGIP